jgi:hypothetical protein
MHLSARQKVVKNADICAALQVNVARVKCAIERVNIYTLYVIVHMADSCSGQRSSGSSFD